MNILFLGYKENQIIDFLSKENDVVVWDEKVNSDFVSQFDYIISSLYIAKQEDPWKKSCEHHR